MIMEIWSDDIKFLDYKFDTTKKHESYIFYNLYSGCCWVYLPSKDRSPQIDEWYYTIHILNTDTDKFKTLQSSHDGRKYQNEYGSVIENTRDRIRVSQQKPGTWYKSEDSGLVLLQICSVSEDMSAAMKNVNLQTQWMLHQISPEYESGMTLKIHYDITRRYKRVNNRLAE